MNHRNRLKMKIRRQWERDCEQDITKNEWDTIGHVCNCPLKVTMVIFLCVCPAPGTVSKGSSSLEAYYLCVPERLWM